MGVNSDKCEQNCCQVRRASGRADNQEAHSEGILITISGIDASGKTTHVSWLSAWLKKEKGLRTISMYDVAATEEYSSVVELDQYYQRFKESDVICVRPYLRSHLNTSLHKQIIYSKVLHDPEAARALARKATLIAHRDLRLWWDHVISRLMAEKKIIVSDRYFYDHIAYRMLCGIEFLWLESLYRSEPRPHLPIFLDVLPTTIVARQNSRLERRTDLLSSIQQIEKLRAWFLYVAERYDMVVVNGNLGIEIVHDSMIHEVEKVL